jgi:hypothetical protein
MHGPNFRGLVLEAKFGRHHRWVVSRVMKTTSLGSHKRPWVAGIKVVRSSPYVAEVVLLALDDHGRPWAASVGVVKASI